MNISAIQSLAMLLLVVAALLPCIQGQQEPFTILQTTRNEGEGTGGGGGGGGSAFRTSSGFGGSGAFGNPGGFGSSNFNTGGTGFIPSRSSLSQNAGTSLIGSNGIMHPKLTGILSIDAKRIPTAPVIPSINIPRGSTIPSRGAEFPGPRGSTIVGAAKAARGATQGSKNGLLGFFGRVGVTGDVSPPSAGVRVFQTPGGSTGGVGVSSDFGGDNAAGVYLRVNL